jgi:hypothetical protein
MEDEVSNALVAILNLVIKSGEAKAMVVSFTSITIKFKGESTNSDCSTEL